MARVAGQALRRRPAGGHSQGCIETQAEGTQVVQQVVLNTGTLQSAEALVRLTKGWVVQPRAGWLSWKRIRIKGEGLTEGLECRHIKAGCCGMECLVLRTWTQIALLYCMTLLLEARRRHHARS